MLTEKSREPTLPGSQSSEHQTDYGPSTTETTDRSADNPGPYLDGTVRKADGMSDSDFDERDVSVEDDDSIPPEEDAADEEEVSSLVKESQMSLDELLAIYGIPANSYGHNSDTAAGNCSNVSRGKSGRLKSIRHTVTPSLASSQELLLSLPPAKKFRCAAHASVCLNIGSNDISTGGTRPVLSADYPTFRSSSDVDALVDKNKADTPPLRCLTVFPHPHSVPCSQSTSPVSIDVSCPDPPSATATPKYSKQHASEDSTTSRKSSSRSHLLRSRSKSNLAIHTSELLDSATPNEENRLEEEDIDTSVPNFELDVENQFDKNEETTDNKFEANQDYSSRFWKSAITGQETTPSYNSDEDEDYCPSEDSGRDWKGEIKIGEDYQANIPMLVLASNVIDNQCDESLSYYGSERIFQESSLLWKPSEKLCETDVTRFERSYAQVVLSTLPNERTIDDEEALFLLMRCDYDTDEALQRLQFKAVSPIAVPGYLDSWSESDCTAFEKSFALCGKDFRQIRETRLRHKTVSELIHFYYLWKKTARHDEFARIYRRDKKKSSHPNIADFMDCLAMEQEILAESYMQSATDVVLSTATSNPDPHKYIQLTSISNIGSMKAGSCQMDSSISSNNAQNTGVVSANCSETCTSRSSVNRYTGLSDDKNDEVTTSVCLDASGSRCKSKSSVSSLNTSTNTTNSINEMNNYNGAYYIKQSDHIPSSSSTRSTRAALSSTVTV
ncbi:mesoderm induction early response 1 related [Schistosoma mansoni]|uniref:Mesoderm induction early response 1 related n=1 Tax=Schistosoma mansoni TaxID=6183 RepID=C4QP07_SCHMA|nr:mesoderm induction early response 1 related [Schistosoma mansoni]|eukprot:XP_018644446.1 mesoderm induction early response 1 related [Schistosoma mansoni]